MVSLFVLLLNDHLLKEAWPGLVTGKVSDVAGLVVAPPLVALLLGRRADLAATILTGALYTLVKATETGAEAASLAWTALAGPSRVLADYTDLLALPALGLAWWVRQRTLRPDPRRRGVLVILPLAVLSVTATGASPAPPAARSVVVDQGSVVVSSDFGSPDLISDDGGRTWRPTALPTEDEGRRAQKAACVPKAPERCYSIADDLMRVMQSDDAGNTWTVSWEVPPERVEALEHALSAADLRSSSLAVQPRQGGGHVVVVANGPDGVAVRDVDGRWRRLGFSGLTLSEDAAVPLTGPARPTGGEMWTAALAALWTVLAGLSAQAVPSVPSSPRRTRPGLIVALSGIGAVALLAGPYLLDSPVAAFLGLTGAVLMITSVVMAASLVPDARLGSRGVVNALAAGVLVGIAVAAPFRGWGEGWIDGYGTALTLALLLGLGSAVGGLVTLRRSARQRVVRGST
ncbi:hypothetical protein ACIBQX_44940 [Nonomuraea sp. NPDC049714]|uniref:hypothetical protein n=1 Tax=Nonomuraea sp. NPDC049714 TaxID=3364357 RepID=UPI0037A0E962